MRQSKVDKLKRRKIQCMSFKTVKPKHIPAGPEKNTRVSRPVMFHRILAEVKQEYERKKITGPRRERRTRMISLARRTMTMMRSH
jgi:hypothetical protein